MRQLNASTAVRLVSVAMLAAAAAAWCLTPRVLPYVVGSLSESVPARFGDWTQIKTNVVQVNPTVNQDGPRDMNNPYDDVLMRTYANSHGEVVLLALAYGRSQRQEVKIHRPDLCYVAQGFKLLKHARTVFPGQNYSAAPITGDRMLVQATGRVEAVSYWIRIGNIYSRSAWATRYYIFIQGIRGRALDGILVRVSQIIGDSDDASEQVYSRQEQFVADLLGAMTPAGRSMLLVGSGA
jgi:EpsI family protein